MKYQPLTLNPFPSVTLKHVPSALPWHLRQLRKGLQHRVRHWAVPSSKVWMALLHGQKRQRDRKQVWGCGETLGKAEGWMAHTLAYSPATRESWHSFVHEFFCPCGYFHMKLNSIMTHKRGSSDAYKLISHFVGILMPRCLPTRGGGKELVALLPKEAHLNHLNVVFPCPFSVALKQHTSKGRKMIGFSNLCQCLVMFTGAI